MTARTRVVSWDERSPGTYRLKWRWAGQQQSTTVYSKTDKARAIKAIQDEQCNISGRDDRIKSGSLWRGEVAVAQSGRSFREVALLCIDAKRKSTEDSKAQWRDRLRSPALAPFLDMPIDAITADDIHAWLANPPKQANGKAYKANTLASRMQLLLSTLKYAHGRGWRADSVSGLVDEPDGDKPGMVITVEQYETLMAHAPSEQMRSLWHVLTFSGLRIGEALAMKCDAVDLERGVIHVRASINGRGLAASPLTKGKSKHAKRVVAIVDETVDVLRPLVAGAPADLFVFHRADGSRLPSGSVRTRWRKACTAAGMPEGLRMHDLRHSNATWMLDDGVPPHVVQQRLGHGSLTILGGTYAHMTKAGQESALASLGKRQKSARPTVLHVVPEAG